MDSYGTYLTQKNYSANLQIPSSKIGLNVTYLNRKRLAHFDDNSVFVKRKRVENSVLRIEPVKIICKKTPSSVLSPRVNLKARSTQKSKCDKSRLPMTPMSKRYRYEGIENEDFILKKKVHPTRFEIRTNQFHSCLLKDQIINQNIYNQVEQPIQSEGLATPQVLTAPQLLNAPPSATPQLNPPPSATLQVNSLSQSNISVQDLSTFPPSPTLVVSTPSNNTFSSGFSLNPSTATPNFFQPGSSVPIQITSTCFEYTPTKAKTAEPFEGLFSDQNLTGSTPSRRRRH